MGPIEIILHRYRAGGKKSKTLRLAMASAVTTTMASATAAAVKAAATARRCRARWRRSRTLPRRGVVTWPAEAAIGIRRSHLIAVIHDRRTNAHRLSL